MVEDIELRIKEFEKFYHFLMSNAPEGYSPWFFPCEPNGKNPCAKVIFKINPNSKGSWHHESARLSKEQCIQFIKEGYNLGISARKDDPLIIGDIDNINYLNQVPQNTLTTTSRKRVGLHFFGWNKDGSAKINLPTDNGEIRSDNQYVLSAGSYVPFNLSNKKDKETFELLPEEIREDKLLGYYTVREGIKPRELTFIDFPAFFKEKDKENLETEIKIKQKEEVKEYPKEGKYSNLFKLKVSDIVGLIPANKRQGHPLHESDTDSNFSLSKDGTLAHCWRHLVTLNAVQYLCVQAGYSKCEDAGTPHKGRGFSKIKGDKKALEVAYNEAVKLGLIKESLNGVITSYLHKTDLAEQIFSVQPYFFDKAGIWWLWNDLFKKWEIIDDTQMLVMVSQCSNANTISSKERTEIIEAMKQYGRTKVPKPINKNWIQFVDKIYDIETAQSFEATPEYFATNPIPYSVSGDPRTPTMDKIFTEWVGKKYVPLLYEIIAFCLLNDYPINRLFCFIGSGLNGKSKFLELLQKFIGIDNCCSTELDSLISSRFEVTRLHKKLVCIMGETNFDEMSKTSILKKLTGKDVIGFEYKNKNLFEDYNYAKIIIATNNLPTTTDKTIGFYRRWLIVDFPNTFNEKKDILKDIPEEEYSNLATNSIIILNNLLKAREFTNEGTIEERAERYESKSNFLGKFIKLFTEEDLNGFITKSEFIKKFLQWSQENKHRTMSDMSIGLKMKEMGYESSLKYFSWMFDNKGGNAKCWLGIKWKN